jgi:hypothetical protein
MSLIRLAWGRGSLAHEPRHPVLAKLHKGQSPPLESRLRHERLPPAHHAAAHAFLRLQVSPPSARLGPPPASPPSPFSASRTTRACSIFPSPHRHLCRSSCAQQDSHGTGASLKETCDAWSAAAQLRASHTFSPPAAALLIRGHGEERSNLGADYQQMKSFSLFPSDGTKEKAKPRLDLYMIFLIRGGRTQIGLLE